MFRSRSVADFGRTRCGGVVVLIEDSDDESAKMFDTSRSSVVVGDDSVGSEEVLSFESIDILIFSVTRSLPESFDLFFRAPCTVSCGASWGASVKLVAF